MPSKYRVKDYESDSYYHIYNRGIDGRLVFVDDQDYRFFEKLLKSYLVEERVVSSPFKSDKPSVIIRKQQMSLVGKVTLVAYCLMPDHYHLLAKQVDPIGITKLVRRVMTGYVMYFNRKYNRRGPLFENVYRAVKLSSEKEVLAVGRLIHLNPAKREKRRFGLVETVTGTNPGDYFYSSYKSYIGPYDYNWVTPVYGSFTLEEYRKYVESPNSEADYEFQRLMIDSLIA